MSKKIVNAVMATLIGASVALAVPTVSAKPKKNVEKCYGISKAKMNDCGTPKHACAGQASKNSDPSEWIYVMKGNCARIVKADSNSK